MSLKITNEHFATLKEMVDKTLTKYPNVAEQYEVGQFTNASKVKDLQRRFCFDVLWASTKNSSFITNELYPYLNDDHIYSALRKLCPVVTKRF